MAFSSSPPQAGYSFLGLQVIALDWESQGRNLIWSHELKQGPWRNAAFWLTSSLTVSWLSYTVQDHHPRVGTVHRKLDPLLSIRGKECPIDISVEVLSSQVFLTCIHLTRTNQLSIIKMKLNTLHSPVGKILPIKITSLWKCKLIWKQRATAKAATAAK